jgi:4-hydroxy-tetrahydrodipicolinate synthase
MFRGLSAFPLTPVDETGIDEAFAHLVDRLVPAGVDSICALGSTGNYAYLTLAERARIVRIAIEHAATIPVMVGIGALRTRDVLTIAEDAQKAGASAVLLAPVSYQRLTGDEVYQLYETVSRHLSIPLCVYDNPGTTHFEFSDDLHGRIAQLPQIGAIKIPAVPSDPDAARARISRLRALVPPHVTIGISGDASAATGLTTGCDAWYSVVGGLFPETALAITRAAQVGDTEGALQLSATLEPLWVMFRQHGSLRVIATAAELLGLIPSPSLPLPLRTLDSAARNQLSIVLTRLNLGR